MKNKKVVLIALFLLVGCVSAKQEEVFLHSSKGKIDSYTKKEKSGCITRLSLSPSSISINLTYGGVCQPDSTQLETTQEILNSFGELVHYFNLKTNIRSKDYFTINLHWKVSHWPLIKFINEDETWPSNISKFLMSNYENKKERYTAYKDILKSKVLASQVYLPVIDSMKQLGCVTELSEYFADPIFPIDKENITREQVIKWGIFRVQAANKEIYPSIKGAIEFNVKCQ